MAKWKCFDKNHPLGTYWDHSKRTQFALEFQFSWARNRIVNEFMRPRLKEMTGVFREYRYKEWDEVLTQLHWFPLYIESNDFI